MKLSMARCIPRLSRSAFANSTRNDKSSWETREILSLSSSHRNTFSTCQALERNKNEVYNTSILVIPDLEHKRIRKKDRRAIPIISPSQEFTDSLSNALEKVYLEEVNQFGAYFPAGLKLDRYLKSRNLPLEGVHLRRKEAMVKDILDSEYDFETVHFEDLSSVEKETKQEDYNKRRLQLEKKHLRGNWVPVTYDKNCAFAYLLARSSAEYAVLQNVLTELKYQEPDFSPQNFFDYGSGIGTGYWASKHVFGKFNEVFCVDPSPEMNDVARNIILKGVSNVPLPLGVSFRLHTPSSTSLKYDLVLSAYSLMELKSAESRIEAIYNMWSRVEENGCLVLVEFGTNAGFQIISEARDFILQADKDNVDIVAPCPHSLSCPRYTTDTVPCNFMAKYRMFEIDFFKKGFVHQELYSYIVLKKGRRSRPALPRLVDEPLRTKVHYICRLCTQRGTLQEVKCPKKSNNELYQFCKTVHWGDEMPVSLDFPPTGNDLKQSGKSSEEKEV